MIGVTFLLPQVSDCTMVINKCWTIAYYFFLPIFCSHNNFLQAWCKWINRVVDIACTYSLFLSFVDFQELIRYLKHTCPAHLYATSVSPPAAQQIISAIKVILGEDGTSRGLERFFPIFDTFFFHF